MFNQEIALFTLLINEYNILATALKDNLMLSIEYEKGMIGGILWSMYALNIISSNEKNSVTRYLNSL